MLHGVRTTGLQRRAIGRGSALRQRAHGQHRHSRNALANQCHRHSWWWYEAQVCGQYRPHLRRSREEVYNGDYLRQSHQGC